MNTETPVSTEQIIVSNITIDIVRKDIKNIHLAVYPPMGRVRIAAPFQVKDDAIRLFAISKLSWIRRQQRQFAGQERLPPREYKERESHYYQGKRYLLHIVEAEGWPKVVLKNKTRIELHVRPGSTIETRHALMTRWYRTQLKKQIPALIKKWEQIMDVQVIGWQVRQMKTRWGSCNPDQKQIRLNLELVKKPASCLEYIIVHEMVHLLERHHNEVFLSYMDRFLPHWRQLKAELNKLPVRHEEWGY